MLTGQATANDYLNLIRLRIDGHIDKFRREVDEIDAKFYKGGSSGGSRHYIALADKLKTDFNSAARDIIRAIPVVEKIGAMNRQELVELTGPKLTDLLSVMAAVIGVSYYAASSGGGVYEEEFRNPMNECRQIIPALLRESLLGLDKVWDIQGGGVTNTIHAGQITGPIQQGTSGSTQNSTMTFDRNAIGRAIEKIEAELAHPSNDAAQVASLRADIATISAQLGKKNPSRSILFEVGRSMRSVAEGVAGSLLTPGVVSSVASLTSIL